MARTMLAHPHRPPKSEPQQWHKFKGRVVKKVFPKYRRKPFKGHVDKVDLADDQAFHIKYEDDDSEWVTYDELQGMLVEKGDEAQGGRQPMEHKQPAKPTAAKATSSACKRANGASGSGSRKPTGADNSAGRKAGLAGKSKAPQRAAQEGAQQEPQEDAADAWKAAGALAHAVGEPSDLGAPRLPAGSHQNPLPKRLRGPPLPRQQAGAQSLSLAFTAQAEGDKEAASSEDIVKQSFPVGVDPFIDHCSQMTIHNGVASMLCLPSVAGRREGPKAQTHEVLKQLDACLRAASTSKSRLLTVRAYIQDLQTGLKPFRDLWAKFREAATPVVAILQAQGPYPDALIMIEAQAAVRPST